MITVEFSHLDQMFTASGVHAGYFGYCRHSDKENAVGGAKSDALDSRMRHIISKWVRNYAVYHGTTEKRAKEIANFQLNRDGYLSRYQK